MEPGNPYFRGTDFSKLFNSIWSWLGPNGNGNRHAGAKSLTVHVPNKNSKTQEKVLSRWNEDEGEGPKDVSKQSSPINIKSVVNKESLN